MFFLIFFSSIIYFVASRYSDELNSPHDSSALFLTPYIENGEIEEAQHLSYVQPFLPNVESHSGYITVDKKHRSHMFFWFCRKTNDWTAAPLIVWLQGGPGLSSMFAFFTENGPFTINKDGLPDYRTYSWTQDFNVLYIDSPVGTGFSFTESDDGYSSNQTQVGENLHETLRQFLILFPELQNNQLILSGQSYAGKFLSSLAMTIKEKKSTTEPKINVYGIFVGNPLISFEHMLPHYNEFLFASGLLDSKTQETLRRREEDILTLMYEKNWPKATQLFEETFFEGETRGSTLFFQLTGLKNHYDILKDKMSLPPYVDFLKTPKVKKALHVGDYVFDSNVSSVKKKIAVDLLKSFKATFENVLEEYRVLVFSGQFDIICSYYLNEKLFHRLSWSGVTSYRENNRYPFHYGETLVGYFKQGKNLTHALIRDAGHIVVADQPQWVLGLLKKFADGIFDDEISSLDVNFESPSNNSER